MAKWDLSKLPEGRKPLPDEWFRERAQMQARIAELEANLAQAVDAIDGLLAILPDDEGPEIDYARTIIAELKGGK